MSIDFGRATGGRYAVVAVEMGRAGPNREGRDAPWTFGRPDSVKEAATSMPERLITYLDQLGVPYRE